MHQGSTIFSQIMSHLPIYEFNKCVKRYNGNHRIKSFTCLKQFYVMAFAQLTYRESLRDIQECLNAMRLFIFDRSVLKKYLRYGQIRFVRTDG
jgi:hypothetical protein